MKNIIILIFLIFSYQGFSQILPSSHGVHHKKSTNAQSDAFDATTKGQYIVITNNNVTSSYPTPLHKWNSVYGSEGISSGIKEWELTIDSYDESSSNTWELLIGIAHSKNYPQNWFTLGCSGHGYISERGDKTRIDNCGSPENYGSTYGEGDVIKIQLNMNNGELIFFKNGISQGVSRIVNTSLTWYLAISIGNRATSVSLTG